VTHQVKIKFWKKKRWDVKHLSTTVVAKPVVGISLPERTKENIKDESEVFCHIEEMRG
jgi:hypothetical protein